MRKTKPQPTPEMLAEADRLDQAAAERREREQESFERCDTDGFLSQWALGIGAQERSAQARLLREGGHAQFQVLCNADGEVIATKVWHFDNGFGGYNRRWKVSPEVYGRKWVPVGENSRVQKQLGLHEETRWFAARAKIVGSGTGLSGAASCRVAIVCTEELF